MKAQRASDLAQLSVEELEAKLAEFKEEQFRIRFRTATEAVENPIQFRTRRRDIARIKTVLRQKGHEA
ncbi:MAG: 50S ribosomal protein L29 [Gemmatimonadales bacterium]|nr:50S ribosomal protein L29 [Gemmatimonadales bacterium]